MTAGLSRFGYTGREATFLGPAALVSGYFLRAQFNVSIGRECGALAQRFIERALMLGHVNALPPFGNRLVYHVSSSALYSALGDSESRNRREHRPDTIRRRLMALDHVISGSKSNWLLSTPARLEWFKQAGLSEVDLPAAVFQGKARCFFPDKQPISIDAGGAEFSYIDDELRSFSRWELFLRAHRPLFRLLRSARVVFAGCEPGRFSKAEKMFRQMVAGETSSGTVDVSRLLQYFEARKLFEARSYEWFDQPRLDELRENKQVFAGRVFDELYSAWLASGERAFREIAGGSSSFSTQVLPHSYEWLSPINFLERRAARCP